MKDFPPTTLVNKVFSESKFFKKLALSRRTLPFGNIEKIVWRNKLSGLTLNIKEGQKVKEIQIFEVQLKSDDVSEAILRTIDNNIFYHILYLVEFNGKFQAWIGYKEVNASAISLTVKTYYKTDWLSFDELPLSICGLTLDEVYENFLSQINSNVKNISEVGLRESVNIASDIAKIEREIERTKSRLFKEKQFNKQLKLRAEISDLKKNLEKLKNG